MRREQVRLKEVHLGVPAEEVQREVLVGEMSLEDVQLESCAHYLGGGRESWGRGFDIAARLKLPFDLLANLHQHHKLA